MIRTKKANGMIMTELIIALGILTVLLACFASALGAFGAINHYYMSKQRCIAAAQAQLDSISVTGEALGEEEFKKLWPKIEVSIEKLQGAGQWQGLTLVKVTTKAKTCGRMVTIELSRYITGPPKG
jgi:type II secretory pathway pseudopilin PulG